ncbi:hypothetical protein ACA910_017628 [Epithemia clementina (nom. ined.)]
MHTTPGGVGGFVMTDGKRSTHVTHSMTNTMWFKRFMDGSHERMGDIKIQDTALTLDVLLALQSLLEESWIEAQTNKDNDLFLEISSLGCAVTVGFSAALRREEFGHLRLNETILLTTQGLQHPHKPHVVVGLEGHFKGQVSRKKQRIPLVPMTKSGIANQTWLFRLLDCYERINTTHGPLFHKHPQDQTSITLRHLDAWFPKYLLCLQNNTPTLFQIDFDLVNKFSFHRSLQRGSTSQARNAKVPKEVINLNNRWRVQDAAGARFAGQSEMLELYTNVLAALETLLQYSESL